MTRERDPRAHWLDDDPFDKQTSPGSHTKARDDGNWRQPHIRVVHACLLYTSPSPRDA